MSRNDFEYARERKFFAVTARGVEEYACREIAALGAGECQVERGGVYFRADHPSLYRIVFCSRLLNAVLAPLASFDCHSDTDLYRRAFAMDWAAIFTPEHTFAVRAVVAESRISHSQYAALRLKDAIVDRFRAHTGKRPSVDPRQPDVWLHLHLHRDRAVISLDVSGGAMHRRGYRRMPYSAPLKETLAAFLIEMSGWQGDRPLLDPFCGSGTILAEALLSAGRIPPAFMKAHFGFEFMPDFDDSAWQAVRRRAEQERQEGGYEALHGSDVDEQAIAAARANLAMIPGGQQVKLRHADFRDLPDFTDGVIVCNPPYGVRLGEASALTGLYRDLGNFLKRRCRGSVAYILCGNRELIPFIGLRPRWRKPVFNGPLECRFLRFDLY